MERVRKENEIGKKRKKSGKNIALRFVRNISLTVLILSPIIGYLGVVYTVQNRSPQDKLPWVHWNGLDPKEEVYVSWETTEAGPSYVYVGSNPADVNNLFIDPIEVKIHHIVLSGLSPDTKYYYQAGKSENAAKAADIRSFSTAPDGFKEFNITLISDTQQMWGTGHYDTITKTIEKWGDTSFVAYAGDVGQEPDDQETWNFFFEQTSRFSDRIPLVPTPGNHDGDDINNLYTDYFTNTTNTGRYYSFNWSTTQFVMAEIADMGDRDVGVAINEEHYAWLNATLEAGQSMDYRILIFHRQVFSSLGNDEGIIARITPVVEKYNVSLVFYGHIHSYERFYYNERTYVCLGGGGGLQDMSMKSQEITQIMSMGASFTQLFFEEKGIRLRTYSPKYDIIDDIYFEKKGSNVVPERITPNGGL